MDAGRVPADNRRAHSPIPQAVSQIDCGLRPDKGRLPVLGGGYPLQSRGRGGGYWGMHGVPSGYDPRPTGGVLSYEAVVLTHDSTETTPPCNNLEKVSGDYSALYHRE